MSDVAAIVLAAGLGMRFGGGKLLAPFGGRPLVRHAVEAALGSCARPVLVVTGHHGDRVRLALDGLAVTFVDNPRFAQGMSTSLQAGFGMLPAKARAVIILLADMPAVSAALIDGLIAAWQADCPDALVPTWQGKRGNPVILSRSLEGEIATLTGDVGAGPLLRLRSGVREIAVQDRGIALDADTPESLARIETPTS